MDFEYHNRFDDLFIPLPLFELLNGNYAPTYSRIQRGGEFLIFQTNIEVFFNF